jgi:hypothetical protein
MDDSTEFRDARVMLLSRSFEEFEADPMSILSHVVAVGRARQPTA